MMQGLVLIASSYTRGLYTILLISLPHKDQIKRALHNDINFNKQKTYKTVSPLQCIKEASSLPI